MLNRLLVFVGLSLAALAGLSGLAHAQQAASGEALVILGGSTHTLQVFECRRDYPSPTEPDRTISLALSAAPAGTPDDLLEPLRNNDDGGGGDVLAAMEAVLARGAVLSLAHHADGGDVVTFFPSQDMENTVAILSEDGFLEMTDEGISGTTAASTMDGAPLGDFVLSAACP
ncbi:hypothetical protein ACFPLB_00410 [Aquamicrobium segne]|uniref:Uncharacterized protein n=1 Tax=Aquamicrobium segne TaxID=469547 RepID=A0ABW0GS28_9HYPH